MINNKYYYSSLILLIGFIFFNLLNPFLWFDEAGQFFISLGLNHYSEPNSLPGTFNEVLLNNNKFNLDPGGFSILLFLWLKISTNYIWIRLLPFLFFISSVFLTIEISKKVYDFKNPWIYGFLLFAIPQLVFRSIELRAYTMEVLSILISIYLIVNFKNLNSYKLLTISILSSILISSRYSSILLFGVVTLLILREVYVSNLSPIKKMKKIIIFSTPLLISVISSYFLVLKNQNPSLSKVDYAPYLSDNFFLFFQDYNWIHLFSLAFLITIFILDKNLLKSLKILILSSILINFTFILVSFFGIYPYSPFDERNLGIFIYTFLPLIYWISIKNEAKINFINHPFFPILLSGIYSLFFSIILKGNWRKNNVNNDLINYKFPSQKIVYVYNDLIPSVRYLFEYTPTEFNLKYPEDFIFLDTTQDIDFENAYQINNYFLITDKDIDDPRFEKIGNSLYKIIKKNE